ncbi:MAG: hypothetical protein ACREQY_09520, partial [Candidatus Binatia bacterium]
MRNFVRIAVVCALAAAPLSGALRSLTSERQERAGSEPILPRIRERGELRVAMRRGTLSHFVHRGRASG